MKFELLTIGIDREFRDYYLYLGFINNRSLLSIHYIEGDIGICLFWFHLPINDILTLKGD